MESSSKMISLRTTWCLVAKTWKYIHMLLSNIEVSFLQKLLTIIEKWIFCLRRWDFKNICFTKVSDELANANGTVFKYEWVLKHFLLSEVKY